MEETKPKTNRKQYFTKIINVHNEKTGFSFVLDELDKSPTYKYAHATHTGNGYRLTGQMDVDDETQIYGLAIKFEDLTKDIHIDPTVTQKELEKVMKSDAFKTRKGAIELLQDLAKRIYSEIDNLTSTIIDNSISESDKQDAYDTITLAARKLLRDQ